MISVIHQVTLKMLQKDVGLLRVKNCIQKFSFDLLKTFCWEACGMRNEVKKKKDTKISSNLNTFTVEHYKVFY